MTISLDKLAETAGSRTGDLFIDGANAAANFVCSVYRTLPPVLTFSTPLGAFNKGFYDRLCNPPARGGLPEPLPPPGSGGKCPIEYWIFAKGSAYYRRATSDSPVYVTHTYDSRVGNPGPVVKFLGPIRSIRPIAPTFGGTSLGMSIRVYYSNLQGQQVFADLSPTSSTVNLQWGQYANNVALGASLIDAIPVSGADSCGDVVPPYPTTPVPGPGGDYTTNFTHNYNDGTDYTFPLIYTPVDIDVPLDVKVDMGGQKFYFDWDGVSEDPPALPEQPDYDDEFDALGDKIDDLGDKIDDLKDNPSPPPPKKPPSTDPDLDSEPRPPEEKEKEVGEKLRWVEITLTTLPSDLQYVEGSPTLCFAGWLEFRSDTAYFPREPINFEKSLFEAPDGATGYAYALVKGAVGYATIYTKKEVIPNG